MNLPERETNTLARVLGLGYRMQPFFLDGVGHEQQRAAIERIGELGTSVALVPVHDAALTAQGHNGYARTLGQLGSGIRMKAHRCRAVRIVVEQAIVLSLIHI